MGTTYSRENRSRRQARAQNKEDSENDKRRMFFQVSLDMKMLLVW